MCIKTSNVNFHKRSLFFFLLRQTLWGADWLNEIREQLGWGWAVAFANLIYLCRRFISALQKSSDEPFGLLPYAASHCNKCIKSMCRRPLSFQPCQWQRNIEKSYTFLSLKSTFLEYWLQLHLESVNVPMQYQL